MQIKCHGIYMLSCMHDIACISIYHCTNKCPCLEYCIYNRPWCLEMNEMPTHLLTRVSESCDHISQSFAFDGLALGGGWSHREKLGDLPL